MVTVKAAPETSRKYGDCVCTAGITREGEWIRLYPIPLRLFQTGRGFRKFDWIEVECKRVTDEEKMGRRESHKIREDSLRVIDSSLRGNGKVDWTRRNEHIFPMRARSVEDLEMRFNEDRTSLGVVRVGELLDLYKSKDLTPAEKASQRVFQVTFEGINGGTASLRANWMLRQIPHIFRYRFRCDVPACRIHDMTCEDWELFEAHRKWQKKYSTEEETWSKIRQRFFDYFRERDLHFFMGTHSMYPSWMIIGSYYPPAGGSP
ncbi:MAG: hypothetical protein JW880_01810 [Candidatus Thermoplasmatota archaeon]|nr:hypothetical protein [Candidatus Thermoplasmatota archaeon]